MAWQILWPLILGFIRSEVIEAVVSHRQMARLLPDDRPRTIAKAHAIGAASSFCSYAAVAIVPSLFRKGAEFAAAMAFQMASSVIAGAVGDDDFRVRRYDGMYVRGVA
jgi:uncharacterized membrane protein YraQ (UPF0718 family)